MQNYLKLVADRKLADSIYKEAITQEKRRLHKEFAKEHKKILLTLDIIMGIIILLNIGALVITNSLVIRQDAVEGKPIEFTEANPVQCKLQGFECSEPATKEEIIQEAKERPRPFLNLTGLYKQLIIWTILLLLYVHRRRNVHSEDGLIALTLIIILYIVGVSLDFFHDLGFYLGKIWWG